MGPAVKACRAADSFYTWTKCRAPATNRITIADPVDSSDSSTSDSSDTTSRETPHGTANIGTSRMSQHKHPHQDNRKHQPSHTGWSVKQCAVWNRSIWWQPSEPKLACSKLHLPSCGVAFTESGWRSSLQLAPRKCCPRWSWKSLPLQRWWSACRHRSCQASTSTMRSWNHEILHRLGCSAGCWLQRANWWIHHPKCSCHSLFPGNYQSDHFHLQIFHEYFCPQIPNPKTFQTHAWLSSSPR